MSSRKIVLITGSIRGIGKYIALEFLSDGYFVILNGTREYKNIIKELYDFKKFEGNYEYFKFDVSNRKEVKVAVSKILEKYSRIDILINNAGITRDKSLIKLSEEDWDAVIDVNLNGVFNLCKEIVPSMKENKFGRIINMSSIIGLSGNFGQTNYAASKAGVIGFTKSLALEVAKYGITVNSVAPGYIKTDMIKNINNNILEAIESKIPVGYMGSTKDVANVVKFLAKDESRYILGETISVNGGMYLN